MTFDFKNFSNNSNVSDTICNLNRSKKLFFTGHEELTISANNDKKEAKVSEIAYNILFKYKNNPKMILKFMESKGTKVVYCPALAVVLKLLGYDEGFIPKHNGFKAFILNFLTSLLADKKIVLSDCMEDVLIICKSNLSLYFIAYQFHHWLSYKHKLPGYDSETMNLFRNTFNNEHTNMSVLSINQILSLKDAIDRDKQAVEFVRKFVREQVGAKQRLQSMLQGQSVKI
ncbi:MAG: hypothetical protein MJ180_00495 [Candidatus Gastranaerophilales bacterium]|nr:hypothetical protein [Candidatus Gastranaerophilales bacterium]